MDSFFCFKPTTDNWCGNYDGNLVKLKYHGAIAPDNAVYRVSVQGADDMMMAFDTNNEVSAKLIFDVVLKMPTVSFKGLKEIGFEMF